MPTRRDFLTTFGAGTAAAAAWPAGPATLVAARPGVPASTAGAAAGALRFACHTMTWGDDYVAGMADIAKAGFHGVQLRANVLPRFGEKPADLKGLLAQHKLAFVCFSGGTS